MSGFLSERSSYERELFELGVSKTRGKAKGKTWRLKSKKGGGRTAIYVPSTALANDPVHVVLFIHGDPTPCGNGVDDEAALLIGSSTFAIPTMVDASQANAVLVAPTMPWKDNRVSHAFGKPKALNAFLEEVRTELVHAGWTTAPTWGRVVLAGHSRAHVVLNALARNVTDKEWTAGALAKVSDIWLIDTTYGAPSKHCATWTDFASAKPSVSLTVAYQTKSDTAPLAECIRDALPNATILAESRGKAGSIHCELPKRVLPQLLSRLKP